ncbi:hydrolytic protein [Streptomyces sp. NPDC058412]|uniref:COG1470 family protein n=1 Tax=Streptomyces sp. NPDC058412 TaxID=3346486 RepID=UPI003666AE2C
MISPAASSSPGAPGLDIPPVSVTPGGTASTSLTVRNDSDIVEAYRLEVVGDCAAWATVEPERVSLYPGTSETVTIRLAPPRSPQVRAGDVPLAVRVLPTEQPEAVRVPETTVHVEEFRELRAESAPKRRRGWLRGRYRLAVRNEGNCPVQLGFTPAQPGEELKFAFTPATQKLEPGESAEVGLRVRTGQPVWFGTPVTWPFTVDVAEVEAEAEARDGAGASTSASANGSGRAREEGAERPESERVRVPLDAEFVQIPIFPRWLLAVLAALLALLLAWFLLVRPAVRSTAKEAAEAVQKKPTPSADLNGQTPVTGDGKQPAGGGKGTQPGAGGAGTGTGTGTGAGGGGGGTGGGGQQSSATIDLQTGTGQSKTGTYTVPAGKVFGITDIVVANFQGDEGVVTIDFGDRKITTIALETFRNQDYHWVTPISITESQTVTVQVTCAKPGTPATGRQAQECHEVLNVSGVLSNLR